MKNSLYIKTKLDNLKASIIPQSVEYTQPHLSRINLLEWIYNGGKLQTQSMIEHKLKSTQEELTALNFMRENGLQTKITQAKLEELQDILEENE